MQDAIIEALRRGAHGEAVEAARNWIAEAPDDAQPHRWLAVALAQAGDAAGALESIDRAIALAPDDAELHLVRGALLLGTRRPDEAQAALAQASGLDPNQLGAYLMQAQLALARGDADEAERLAKLAARVAPGHPQLAAIEGTVALRRGDADGAVRRLAAATQESPSEPHLYYALGFAYLAQGHAAFAEQAFARVLELMPAARGLRALIADLMLRQGRPGEALDQLRPMLEQPNPGFALQRIAGLLEMAAGRPDRALPWLSAAFDAQPGERRVLSALVDAWRALGDPAPAREALDAALAVQPGVSRLWEARMVFAGRDEVRTLIDRWLEAIPDHPGALDALATLQDLEGDAEAALATTRRVVELAPGRVGPELRLALLEQRDDPAAAVARLERLVAAHDEPLLQRRLRAHLGIAQDRAGLVDEAVATWTALNAERLPQAIPRPAPVAAPATYPASGEPPADAPAIALLWGGPGSGVGRLAEAGVRAGLPLLRDRFGEQPWDDPLQSPDTAAKLVAGDIAAEAVVAQWRETLPSRGHLGGPLIDWIPWWDNALLLALRPHLPEAVLLVAVRDPRDMLLDWLAFGGAVPLALESPEAAARWLAGVLDQVATLHDDNLYPHRLVRLDDAVEQPAELIDALNVALDLELAPPPPSRAPAIRRLPAGRWRDYTGPLGTAFDALSDVARRLGYAAG